MKQTHGTADVTVRLTFKQEKDAREAVRFFDQQVADGRTLGVRVIGGVNASLSGRLSMGVMDGSVDVLMETDTDGGSCVFLCSDEVVSQYSYPAAKCARTISSLVIQKPPRVHIYSSRHQVLTQKTIFHLRRRVEDAVADGEGDVVERPVGVGENTGRGDGLGNDISFLLSTAFLTSSLLHRSHRYCDKLANDFLLISVPIVRFVYALVHFTTPTIFSKSAL